MASYAGYIPSNTILNAGDYMTSPSGTYYGISGGNQWWIVPGSNPSVAPCCTNGWTPPATTISDTYLANSFTAMQTDGNFVVYTSDTGTNTQPNYPVWATQSQQPGLPGQYIGILNDDGSFEIKAGPTPQDGGITIWSATNSPFGAVSSIDLTSITYDFSNASFTSLVAVSAGHVDLSNDTVTPQEGYGILNLSWGESYSLSFSVADAVGESISATTTVGLPGIAKEGLSVGISNETTITHGRSDTTTTQILWQAGFTPTIQPFTTVRVEISGVIATYEVPYEWTGVATYAHGATANVVGTGVFTGGGRGNFTATATCTFSVLPYECDPGAVESVPIQFTPVPEPATAVMLATALMSVAVARRFRGRATA